MPVFSTIGEPATVPPLSQREPQMVVFGGTGTRDRAYADDGELLALACRDLGLTTILDIGPGTVAPQRVDGVPVRALGTLDDRSVAATLLQSRAGFLAYPRSFLPKSTTFAAYCAHGVLPVCPPSTGVGSAEPTPPCWSLGVTPVPPEPQAVAQAALGWYREHALDLQAVTIAELLS